MVNQHSTAVEKRWVRLPAYTPRQQRWYFYRKPVGYLEPEEVQLAITYLERLPARSHWQQETLAQLHILSSKRPPDFLPLLRRQRAVPPPPHQGSDQGVFG